ncbi:MAG: RAMP superfamily CRISPR-associated protein [Gammaproteobacteria bacterium]|nr:RAMP superfamily CRISPR-associated protein [Gammaproteobacteria bacterium]
MVSNKDQGQWLYVDIPLSVVLEGALQIGTGYDWGLIDRTVVRDCQGNVYIPASSLKGKARNACEDLGRRCGLSGICGLPHVGAPPSDHEPDNCLVCRVFGAPGGNDAGARSLYWDDAPLDTDWLKQVWIHEQQEARPAWQTTTRTQVRLSRSRGTAADGLLYTSESSLNGFQFRGRISGWLKSMPCTLGSGYYEVIFLLAGLRLIHTLGGGRSRGAGRCRVLPEEIIVRLQGQAEAETYTLQDMLLSAEFLGLFPE